MRDKPAEELPSAPVPLALVLLVLATGVVVMATGHWRRASVIIASATAMAAILRLVLPARVAGLLVVRRRWIDVTVLLLMAVGISLLAYWVPPYRP